MQLKTVYALFLIVLTGLFLTESGNPAGRPKKTQAQIEFETKCQNWSAEHALRKRTELAENIKPKVAIWALNEILDRALIIFGFCFIFVKDRTFDLKHLKGQLPDMIVDPEATYTSQYAPIVCRLCAIMLP